MNAQSHDRSFAVLKAIAIIFVVIAHSGGPSWLVSTAYIFCVPVFFMSTGYFFNLAYLNKPTAFLWHRFRRIYIPFWTWSVFFLIFHNFFLWIGILSSDYGNVAGGTAKAYSWHDFAQNLWSITFNMSGYDPFLAGAFWFFRTLFISSIVFYFLYLFLHKYSKYKTPVSVGGTILCLSLLLLIWQVIGNLKITGIAQGGYRELLGLMFISLGFLYHQFQRFFRPSWFVAILGIGVLAIFSFFCPSSMRFTADFNQFIQLPLPAFCTFVALHAISCAVVKRDNRITQSLVYIGDRTLYIFAFHLLAFKVVSFIKVIYYDLPWSRLGAHTVVHEYDDDFFYIFYILAGVLLPLLVVELWKKMDHRYNLTWYNCLVYTLRGLFLGLIFLKKIIIKISLSFWKSVKGFFLDLKGFIKASNPKDE